MLFLHTPNPQALASQTAPKQLEQSRLSRTATTTVNNKEYHWPDVPISDAGGLPEGLGVGVEVGDAVGVSVDTEKARLTNICNALPNWHGKMS